MPITAESINTFIQRKETENGRTSIVHGLGQDFIDLGDMYGVDYGIAVGMLALESQMGTDESWLHRLWNNLGGNTCSGPGDLSEGAIGCEQCIDGHCFDRYYKVFKDGRAAIEGYYQNVSSDMYRNAHENCSPCEAGSFWCVRELYAPSFENDAESYYQTVKAVYAEIGGGDLDKCKSFYTGPGSGVAHGPVSEGGGDGGFINMIKTLPLRIGVGIIGAMLIGFGLWQIAQ